LSSFFRNAAVMGALTLGLIGTTAATALASAPDPAPTGTETVAPPTPDYTKPPPRPACDVVAGQPLPADFNQRLCPTVRQEDLDITITPLVQPVVATGPITFQRVFARDITVSPVLEIDTQFGNSIFLRHRAFQAGDVTIDPLTCSVNLLQTDQNAVIAGRSGLFRRAVGDLTYDLTGQFSYPTRGFRCTLPAGLTPARAAFALNHNGFGLPAPLDFDVHVQGAGWASVTPLVTVPPVTCYKPYPASRCIRA
jgi:hypothetical protein